MRTDLRLLRVALIAGLALAGTARAADDTAANATAPQAPPPAQTDEAPQAQDTDRPEYHSRPLPDDTFTPKESLPEDFPVAFPTDM